MHGLQSAECSGSPTRGHRVPAPGFVLGSREPAMTGIRRSFKLPRGQPRCRAPRWCTCRVLMLTRRISRGCRMAQGAGEHWLLTDSSRSALTKPVVSEEDRGGRRQPCLPAKKLKRGRQPRRERQRRCLHRRCDLGCDTITGGKFPAKYPTKEAWADGLASFLAYVGPALKAKGYYVAVNADAYTPNNGSANDGSLHAAWAPGSRLVSAA